MFENRKITGNFFMNLEWPSWFYLTFAIVLILFLKLVFQMRRYRNRFRPEAFKNTFTDLFRLKAVNNLFISPYNQWSKRRMIHNLSLVTLYVSCSRIAIETLTSWRESDRYSHSETTPYSRRQNPRESIWLNSDNKSTNWDNLMD